MPVFRINDVDSTGSNYGTHTPHPPGADTSFHLLLQNWGSSEPGRGCCYCRTSCGHSRISSIAWGSGAHVACLPCAEARGAPTMAQVSAANPGIPPSRFGIVTSPNAVHDSVAVGEETNEELSGMLITKRDRNFDPGEYCEYIHTVDLSFNGGTNYGCCGYRCADTAAPLRTLKAGVKFWLGNADRGFLCNGCYQRLKTKWEVNAGPLEQCRSCERKVREINLAPTVYDGRVCARCIREYYYHCPVTDGGHVRRAGLVQSTDRQGRQVYASIGWARQHWFYNAVRNRWYTTEEAALGELFNVDAAYRNERVTRNGHSLVFDYGTNIIKMLGFPLKETSKDALCFGVELEMVPASGKSQHDVCSALGGKWISGRPYILCRDGSLGDAGVEMITLPYTLATHKKDTIIPWTKLLSDLRQVAKSGKGTQVCGMHVHINKRALSQLQLGKMLAVINAPTMQELIAVIAQRGSGGWAHRSVKKIVDGKRISGTHYDALNVGTNKGTCELRIFRGNLRWERVMKNLEFAEALCMYGQDQSMQKLSDPAAFVGYVKDMKMHYPHLDKFLREHYKPSGARATLMRQYRDNPEAIASRIQVIETEGDI